MKSISIVLFLVFLSNGLNANNITESSDMFFIKKSEVVTISLVNGIITINGKITEHRKFNISTGHDFATIYINENKFFGVNNIVASYTIYNEKGKGKTSKITSITKKSSISDNVFYDDNSYYEIEFPNIKKGATTNISYSYTIPDPHFLKAYYFSQYNFVESSEFEIIADSNIHIGYNIFGEQQSEIEFKQTAIGNKISYKWKLRNAKPYKIENNSPGLKYKTPHIIPYIKSYSHLGKTENILHDTKDLFDWYQSLLSKIDVNENDSLVRLTNTIIEGATSDLNKAEKIFKWIQKNIRYVAIEDGWRGFIPFPANEICTKRYGDCKDMAHLTYTMLKIAGLNAEHAWVGTRTLPYRYDELPTPYVDNHMVVVLKLDGQIYILDATDSYTPFGVPTTFILSKQIMFNNNGEFELYQVPDYDPEFCTNKNNINIKLEGMSLKGDATKTIETFEYTFFTNVYNKLNISRELFLDAYLELGNNNFRILSQNISEPIQDKTCEIKYQFEIPGHIKKFGSSYFINLNLTSPYKEMFFQNNRSNNINIEYKEAYIDTVNFILPQQISSFNIPDDISFNNKFGSVESNYLVKNSTIQYIRKITIKTLMIHSTELSEWNQFIKSLHTVYTSIIELKYEN